MSKKKNKGKKPEQKDIKKTGDIKETEVKETEELDEEVEAAEDEEAEVSEPEEAEDQIEESEADDEETEKKSEKKSEKNSDKKSGKSEKKSSEKASEPKNDKTKSTKTKGAKAETSERDEFLKLSFIDKCKKDPVIPVMLLLAFVAVIVAVIYFVLPNAKTHSLGFTLDEFKTRYNNGEVATQLYANGLDIGINYTTYVDHSTTPSILGEKETFTVDSNNVDYFNGDVSLILTAGVEGATRKNDSELAYVRVYVEYEYEPVWMIFANTMQAIFPDLTRFDALDLAVREMNDHKADGTYTVRGDIAFRWIPVKTIEDGEEKIYIVIEAVPKSAISQSQIGSVLEVNTTESTASSAAASEAVTEATTVASAAET